MTATRTETDSFGPLEVPADKYWGAQTQRSIMNFPIGWEKQPIAIVRALGVIKKACAQANRSPSSSPHGAGNRWFDTRSKHWRMPASPRSWWSFPREQEPSPAMRSATFRAWSSPAAGNRGRNRFVWGSKSWPGQAPISC